MRKLIALLKRLFRRPFEMHKDMKLPCAECGGTFRFEWGEQQFYKSRGLTPPKRCPACRSGKGRFRGGRDNGKRPGPTPRQEFRRDNGRDQRDFGRRDARPDNNRDDVGSSRYIDDRPFYGEERGGGRREGREGRGGRRRR